MAHAHTSNTKRIWNVFWILSALTIVEVVLGIYKPVVIHHNIFLGTSILNWIFIILTIVKAYYIVWAFMHMEGEKASLRWSVVGTTVFLIIYIIVLFLIEAVYVEDVMNGPKSVSKWIF
ncbi:MAG: cytochrome C oxidase subunit IV family protein [Flavobacteriaceae bacterium]